MHTTVVTTTINVPTFLKAYADNVKYYEHTDVDFIVIGDRKTPEEARQVCESIKNCRYYDLKQSRQYLHDHKFEELLRHLPVDTIALRNIGHVMAYQEGADVIVMLDDDNLATSHDFVTQHGIVGKPGNCRTYSSRSGWFNVCDSLQEENNVRFYARGYPPDQRWNDGSVTFQGDKVTPAVNAGLWVNDPDIDALTRLERHLITVGMKPEWPQKFALCPGTWSPWNCQNTAISREALPSYFLSPWTGRHLDIWASYITTKIAERMGQVIAFGAPLAFHDRSPHNLYSDLEQELPWICRTDEFCRQLKKLELKSETYLGCLLEVTDHLRRNWIVDSTPEPIIRDRYVDGLRAWHATFDRLGD